MRPESPPATAGRLALGWKVRIDGQYYVASSIDELRKWYREGRVRPDTLVFHPVLADWMKASDLEELRGTTTTSDSTPPLLDRLSPKATAAIVAIGVAIIAGLIFIATLMNRVEVSRRTEQEARYNAQREKIRLAALAAARTRLSSLANERQPTEFAQQCETIENLDRASMSPDLLARCAAAHFAVARRLSEAANLADARRAYGIARVTEGGSGAAYERFDAELTRRERKAREKAAAEQKALAAREARDRANAETAARRAYAELLRNRFLDQNLDIKVTVSGAKAERITLKFALFNDVWAHRIQKDGLLEELRNMGYTRVSLSDGYDYGVYWDFKK